MLSIIIGLILGYLIYYKLIKPMGFWSEMGIIQEPPWPIVGNMGSALLCKKHMFDIARLNYLKFRNERYVGLFQFTQPLLMLHDLELVKRVYIKDFDHFRDHMVFGSLNPDELLAKSLMALTEEQWKQMRVTLSPAFTSSKMRNMYLLMVECARSFCEIFQNKVEVNVDVYDIFSRFATNVIASTAFGIQVDCIKEPKHEFYLMGLNVTNFSFARVLKFFIGFMSPTLAQLLKIRMMDSDTEAFFKTIIMNNIKERKEKKIVSHDLIHLLIEAQKGTLKHEEAQEKKEGFATVEEFDIGQSTKMVLTDDHVVAQALLFFFAGFATVSTVASFMAYELAINPDVQKKLQKEIDLVSEKFPEEVPYEALMSMKYLDQVVSETLRKWPPAFSSDRLCNKEFEIVPEKAHERKVVVKKGIIVGIPIVGFHYDPKYYPDPERFDPERFSEENKSKIVPGTYIPFGLGPRNCIGSRFALLEIKTLFFHLLANFDLVPNNKTKIPLIISPKKLNISPEDGFHLNLKPRN